MVEQHCTWRVTWDRLPQLNFLWPRAQICESRLRAVAHRFTWPLSVDRSSALRCLFVLAFEPKMHCA